MEPKYCAAAGRSISPDECGTFERCEKVAECKVRQYYTKRYGWPELETKKSGKKPVAKPKQDPAPALKEEDERTCNMCHRALHSINFRMRKDGKGRKKTCFECEDKYIKKTKPTTPRKKDGNSVAPKKPNPETELSASRPVNATKAPTPTIPKNQKQDPALDLSSFSWIENTYGNEVAPMVRFKKGEITFNAAARRQFAETFGKTQTVDIGHKQNGKGVQFAFVLREDLFGQYRVTNGRKTKSEFKISIRLEPKGLKVGVGPWPVKLINNIMLAEVG